MHRSMEVNDPVAVEVNRGDDRRLPNVRTAMAAGSIRREVERAPVG